MDLPAQNVEKVGGRSDVHDLRGKHEMKTTG
jgi:hypothetical protein